VVVGAFVHNGHYFSAPAFVTSYTMENQTRLYDTLSGKLLRVDHSNVYVHPDLSTEKFWTSDSMFYDAFGNLEGWFRTQDDTVYEFTREGYLVSQKSSPNGVVEEVKQVNYSVNTGGKLQWVPLDSAMRYCYIFSAEFCRDNTPPSVPQNLTTTDIKSSSIGLSWQPSSDAGSGISWYKIYRDGVECGKTVDTTFTDRNLDAETQYEYTVSALNGSLVESSQSTPTSITTSTDTVPPAIVAVQALDVTTVQVVFSEPVDSTTAQNSANYTISSGISVQAAALGQDLVTVVLTCTPLSQNSYTLSVRGVTDTAAVPNGISTAAYFDFTFAPGENGLVAFWPMDDAHGTDATGHGHDGIASNVLLTTGKVTHALKFDGTGNITVPDHADLQVDTFTIAMWVYVLTIEDNVKPTLIIKGGDFNDYNNSSFRLNFTATMRRLEFSIGNGTASQTVTAPLPFIYDKWYHITAVADGDSIKLFLDGRRMAGAAQTVSVIKNSSPLYMGIADTSGAGQYWGFLDDVRLYNIALSAGDIDKLYQGRLNSMPQFPVTQGPAVFRVYPNPFSSNVFFEIRNANSELRDMRANIYDIQGKLIQEFNFRGSHSAFRNSGYAWDARNHPNGLYLVRIMSGKHMVYSRKIILCR
jgi:hypothetical protein